MDLQHLTNDELLDLMKEAVELLKERLSEEPSAERDGTGGDRPIDPPKNP